MLFINKNTMLQFVHSSIIVQIFIDNASFLCYSLSRSSGVQGGMQIAGRLEDVQCD
jgi:hypothetical protein